VSPPDHVEDLGFRVEASFGFEVGGNHGRVPTAEVRFRGVEKRLVLPADFGKPVTGVVRYDELDRILPTVVWMTAGLPTFYPAALIGGILGQHFQDSQWIVLLLTAAELAMGTWLIRRSPKRTIAYSLFVMLMSAIGSLAFYQLCVF
jgi:hypothetical protein